MINIKPVFKIHFLIVVLSILLNACGGGGGGDDSGESEGGGDSPTPVSGSGNVNGGLTGQIFMQDGWIIDIPTGKSKRVPGVIWDSYCYERNFNDIDNDFRCTISNPEIDYGIYVRYTGYPNINGDEYLLTASKCVNGHGLTDSDCLEVRSVETGEIIGERLSRFAHINGGAKLSRDGQYYAYSHNEQDNIFAHTSFIINNRNHEEITSITLDKNTTIPFDWGQSGEIVLAYDGALYLTPPYSLDGSKIFDLRDHPELTSPDPNSGQFTVNGIGGSLRISPDGKRIAVMLFEGGHSIQSYTPKAAWIMNIDGTDVHRLAYVPNTKDEVFGSLAWSPDGKYILITEGYVSMSAGSADPSPGYLYAIPSYSRNVELNKEGNDGIIMLKTNYREMHQNVVSSFFGDGFWWVP